MEKIPKRPRYSGLALAVSACPYLEKITRRSKMEYHVFDVMTVI